MSMSDVLFEVRGRIGVITLNRPQALNALTHAMCNAIRPQLASWATDAGIAAVVIQGAGEKAFCAGGDVLGLHAAGKAGSKDWEDFFFDEYRLNHAIATYPKPYIALLNGMTMGGGVGLSAHGKYRVASERFMFAMPETGIGLIPDVGGTHVLAQLPGEVGMFLGLTGERLKAADALAIGLCTHYVPADQMSSLLDALIAEPDAIDAVLAQYNREAGEAGLLAKQADIDVHFSGTTVEAIINSLGLGNEWAVGVRDHLLKMSPTSIKLSYLAIHAAKGDSIASCLRREYRMVYRIKYGSDFFEGVRAQLIDKDRKPIWKPAKLEDVTEDMISDYLRKPERGDLQLP
jgi:enoyl-CoA hydratase